MNTNAHVIDMDKASAVREVRATPFGEIMSASELVQVVPPGLPKFILEIEVIAALPNIGRAAAK